MKNLDQYIDKLNSDLQDNDYQKFIEDLGCLAKEKFSFTHISKKSNLGRESLYKIFSGKSNCHFFTVMLILKSMGIRLNTYNFELIDYIDYRKRGPGSLKRRLSMSLKS